MDMASMEVQYGSSRYYLESRYPSKIFEQDQKEVMTPWNVSCYHKFYQQFHTEWDNSTATVLELAGGPCIYTHICAAPYVAEIYHADYVKSLRDEVVLWKDNNPKAYDWSTYFSHVVNTLEGKSGPEAVAQRMTRVRSVLKDVLHCDIRLNPMLPVSPQTSYTIVSSNFCMEVALESIDAYLAVLTKIFNLLKPKGYFTTLVSLEESWYVLNGIKCPCPLTLCAVDVKSTLEKAGFVIRYEELREKALEGRNINNDTTGQLFVVAQRPEDA